LLGGLIIISGISLISLDFSSSLISFKKKIFLLMGMSSLLYAVYSLLFKLGARDVSFWVASFWFYTRIGFAGLSLLSYAPFRKDFMNAIKTNAVVLFGAGFLGEGLNLLGVVVSTFSFLLGSIAVIWVLLQTQPVFVFFFGLILTLVFPSYIKEYLSGKILLQKLGATVLMLEGLFLL
jgi:hypothetical protein